MLANYRWFFRLLAILCILFSTLTILLLPYTPSSYSTEKGANVMPRWKVRDSYRVFGGLGKTDNGCPQRMDIVGVVIMTGCLICFILALTQGPIDGWGSPSFIAPIVLAFVLGPAFFLWESRLPAKAAVLPVSIWKTTNITISSIVILYPFAL